MYGGELILLRFKWRVFVTNLCCLRAWHFFEQLKPCEIGTKLNWLQETNSAFPSAVFSFCCLLEAGFLLDLLFEPDNGNYMCLESFRWFSPGHTTLRPRRQTLHYSPRFRNVQRLIRSQIIFSPSHRPCLLLFRFLAHFTCRHIPTWRQSRTLI